MNLAHKPVDICQVFGETPQVLTEVLRYVLSVDKVQRLQAGEVAVLKGACCSALTGWLDGA